MMWITPGAKCVCINDDWEPHPPWAFDIDRVPMIDELLTIDGVLTPFAVSPFVYLVFKEIPHPALVGWRHDHFRPLIESPKSEAEDLELFCRWLEEAADGRQLPEHVSGLRAAGQAGLSHRPAVAAAARHLAAQHVSGHRFPRHYTEAGNLLPSALGGRISSSLAIAGTCGRLGGRLSFTDRDQAQIGAVRLDPDPPHHLVCQGPDAAERHADLPSSTARYAPDRSDHEGRKIGKFGQDQDG